MRRYLYIILFFVSIAAYSQEAEVQKDEMYTSVEVKPEFPGGMPFFYKYISTNYVLPKGFKGSGKVIAQFVIEKDGSITDIRILRDLGSGTGDELVRVLKNSPKWKPGLQKGVPVRVLYMLPLSLSDKR